jgi:hypothetical protein
MVFHDCAVLLRPRASPTPRATQAGSPPRVPVLLAALLAIGCGRPGSSDPGSADAGRFSDHLAVHRALLLEETEDVINVSINVAAIPGGFLVADQSETQLREYDVHGGLRRAWGSRGEGPGEFRYPVGVAPFGADSLLAADMFGRLTVYSPAGYARTMDSRLVLYGATPLPDGSVLLAGRRLGGLEIRIHSVEPGAGSTRAGPVVATIRPEIAPAFESVGMIGAAARDSRRVFTLATNDSLYLYDARSQATEVRALPFTGFRPMTEPRPREQGMAAIREWVSSFSLVSEVYLLDSGVVLVQYQDRPEMTPHWRLLAVDTLGNRLFELRDSPRLFTVMPGDTLVFHDPESETPNRWLLATLR